MKARSLLLLAVGLAAARAEARERRPVPGGMAPTVDLDTNASALRPAAEDAPAPVEEGGLRLRDLPLEGRNSASSGLVPYLPGASQTASGLRLRGGAAANVAHLVDGFRVWRLQPPVPFLRGVEVLATGYGVALSDVPEGAILMTSSERPQTLRADFDASWERNRTTSPGVGSDYSFASGAVRDDSARAITATVSGPVISNRLTISGSLGHVGAASAGQPDLEGIFPTPPEETQSFVHAALGATYLISPRHRIDGLGLFGSREAFNGAGIGIAPDAQPARYDRAFMTGLRWTGVLGDHVTAGLRAGVEQSAIKLESMLCRSKPDQCESIPAQLNSFPRTSQWGNSTRFERWNETRGQAAGTIEVRLGNALRAQHRIRLGSRVETGDFERRLTAPGGRVDSFEGFGGNEPFPGTRTTYYSNDPRVALAMSGWTSFSGNTLRFVHTLEDEVRLWKRLWITPGIGLVTARTVGAGDTPLLSDTVPTWHFGGGWDATGDGRTWVRATTSRRVDPGADGLGVWLPSTQIAQRCLWNPATSRYDRNCEFSGGTETRTIGLPCGSSGLAADGSPCVDPPTMSRTLEHSFGARRFVTQHSWLDLDFIYRRTSGLPVVMETNRIWNNSGTALAMTGGYRNGRAEVVPNLATPEQSFRRYVGATLAYGGRLGPVRGLVAYTYAQQERTHDQISSGLVDLPPSSRIFLTGPDMDDKRHGLRVIGTVDLLGAASFGLVHVYDSGRPYSSYFFNPINNTFSDRRSRVGQNPGVDINDPDDDRDLRLPATHRLNLQAKLRLGRWLPFGADLYGDVINLLEDRPPASEAEGRWVRVGAELRY